MSLMANGSHEAFTQLVKKHTRYFYNIAYRVTLNKEAAEDIVQNCFMKIWQKPALWVEGKAKFKTWFYRIVTNAAIDDKRRFKTVQLVQEVADEQEDLVEKKQDENLLEKALLSIPARQRAAIMLVYYEEMKQSEAAEILDINIKALESLLSRGKKKLEEVLR